MTELAGASTGTAIFAPFFGMMFLTLAVWVVMYVLRIRFMLRERIEAQSLTTPERAAELISGPAANAANNLKNLFELPVLFYALCLYLYVTASVDGAYVALAWAFLALRVLHSVVHCSFNLVILRFYLYIGSAAVLWAMLFRAVLR
jgi:hypothetical protein